MRPASPETAARSPLLVALVDAALLVAGGLLVAGLFAPLLTVNRLLLFSDTYTLLSALRSLLDDGELGLFALLGGFSVLFPIGKLLCLLWVWNARDGGTPRARRAFLWLARFGKWSMLDVFVVAMLAVAVKLRWVADVEVRWGLYLIGGSVLSTMVLSGAVARLAPAPRGP